VSGEKIISLNIRKFNILPRSAGGCLCQCTCNSSLASNPVLAAAYYSQAEGTVPKAPTCFYNLKMQA